MKTTHHIQKRMNQRGMSKAIVQCVIDFGDIHHDQYLISQDLAIAYIHQIKKELNQRCLKKVSY